VKDKDRYAKLGGRLWRHEKAVALSAEAGWLWTRALSYVVDQMTDGLVPRAVAEMLAPKRYEKLAAELVAVTLWIVDPAGWRFHDYEDHNITKAKWSAKKAATARRVADHRERTSESSNSAGAASVTPNVTRYSQTQDARRKTSEISIGGVLVEPVALDPTPPPPEHLHDVVRFRWARDFEAARGLPGAPANDMAVRALVAWLEALPPSLDRRATHDAIATAYWREPWPRDRANRPSMTNLVSQLDRLAGSLAPKPAVIAPEDWNRIHGLVPDRRTA
jgi:hypothetical protein